MKKNISQLKSTITGDENTSELELVMFRVENRKLIPDARKRFFLLDELQ